MKKIALFLFCVLAGLASAQNLSLEPGDILVEPSVSGGYHLWIRQKPGMESVMLTESTADPAKRAASYSYRALSFNEINGNEKRLLNGAFLKNDQFYLIDSTTEEHPVLGRVFHILLPYVVAYGNPWSRGGEELVVDGTFMSIRAFSKPYGDYTGGFFDNPFVLRVSQRPMDGGAAANIMPDALRDFTRIADSANGKVFTSTGVEDVPARLAAILKTVTEPELDLVIAFDTTESMRDDLPALQKDLIPVLQTYVGEARKIRVGMVLYRDYMEEYIAKPVPFMSELSGVQRVIDSVRIAGGRDIPEAVFEALYSSVQSFEWVAKRRMVVLIGDAPAHPRPRGSVTEDMVYKAARERNVEIYTIILPQ